MTTSQSNVVIIGGGFAATMCARILRKKVSRDNCRILLFSRENHMVFHPLLADVAGASLHPDSAAATLRQMLPGVECRTDVIQRIDTAAAQIEYQNDEGQTERTGYNHLVTAGPGNLAMTGNCLLPLRWETPYVCAPIIRQLEKAEA
jgi:NADH dehydrogenase